MEEELWPNRKKSVRCVSCWWGGKNSRTRCDLVAATAVRHFAGPVSDTNLAIIVGTINTAFPGSGNLYQLVDGQCVLPTPQHYLLIPPLPTSCDSPSAGPFAPAG